MMTSRTRMRGVGGFTVLVYIAFFLLVLTFGLTVGKDYLQYLTVRSVVADVAAEPGAFARSDRQLWSEIDRRFTVNSVYDLPAREITHVEQENEARYLVLEYEVRRGFVGNLDLVVQFNRREQLAR